MLNLIELTEVLLKADVIQEIPVLLDPMDISIIEKGTQMTSNVPLINRPNQSMPISVITVKSGRRVAVKETFQQIIAIITNLYEGSHATL